MNNQEFKNAFDYLVKEKGLDPELIKEAMTNAFTAAYKRILEKTLILDVKLILIME